MKVLSILFAMAVITQAPTVQADYRCSTTAQVSGHSPRVFQETFDLTWYDSSKMFSVTRYGASRNQYLANYRIIGSGGVPKDHFLVLQKVRDLSTWQDMPAKLTIRYVWIAQSNLWNIVIEGLNTKVLYLGSQCSRI